MRSQCTFTRESLPTSLRPHRFNFFEDLPPDAWRDECPALSVVEFDNKETVYLQGDACGSFFLIVDGHVKLSRVNRQGGQFTLALMAKGELFGPASYHQNEAQETATAKGSTRLYRIQTGDFKALLTRRPALAWRVIQALSGRQEFLERKLECLLFNEVQARVAETLLDLSGHYSGKCVHGFELDIHVTQQELADLVGASRPVVSTILNDLRDQGILAYTRDLICIVRLKALEHLLSR